MISYKMQIDNVYAQESIHKALIVCHDNEIFDELFKELETDGIVNRKVHQVVPPKVEYSLTEFGLSVIPILRSFSDWNKRNIRTISLKLNKNFEENRIT